MGKGIVDWNKWGVKENKDRQWVALKAKWLYLIKIKGGCCHLCGEDHIGCLEFHHKGKKEDQISWMIMGYGDGSLEKAKKEIDDCDLVCRRCHSDIHWKNKRGNDFKRKCLSIKGVWHCEHCGWKENLSCLEFHHRKGKDGMVKQFRGDENKLKEEINKCDVLCKNCHRKIHWNEERWQKFLPVIEEYCERLKNNLFNDEDIDKEKIKELKKIEKKWKKRKRNKKNNRR